MPLQCNIDAKGKSIRLIYGIVLSLAGVLMLVFWAMGSGGWMAWTVSLLVLLSGGFSIFEARAGWCVVRAMGFRTPI